MGAGPLHLLKSGLAVRLEEEGHHVTIRDWAQEHDLPYFDGQVHFPDYRIEYEVDGREQHQDVELFTPHYRGAHAASRAKTGFRIYVVASRGRGGRSGPHPRGMEEFL
jgi:hypothetical protein